MCNRFFVIFAKQKFKGMVYDVFISYRRDGGYETAKHINDLLVRDGYTVSFDIDTLREGDFDEALFKRIEQCRDFLLIVDPHCFDRTIDESCSLGQDWLRQEVAYALKLKKNIVPVLLAGAHFPQNLPEDIAAVTVKNGPEYSRGYFDSFYDKMKNEYMHATPRNIVMQHMQTNETRVGHLKLKTDLECLFYLDGEECARLKPGEIQKIPLAEGEYELRFVSVENDSDAVTDDFVMPAVDKLYKVSLFDVSLSRIELEETEKAERERDKAKRKAKKVAERERLEKERVETEKTEQKAKKTSKSERSKREQKTEDSDWPNPKQEVISIDGYEYVDLGLPSGTLWATCNVGASNPEDYGDYFSLDDGIKNTANLGNGWYVPTKEQWEELMKNTKNSWRKVAGVKGWLFRASNGNSLFLPAAGYCHESSRHDDGYYWSSSRCTDHPKDEWYLYFNSGSCGMYHHACCEDGQCVRAVCSLRHD